MLDDSIIKSLVEENNKKIEDNIFLRRIKHEVGHALITEETNDYYVNRIMARRSKKIKPTLYYGSLTKIGGAVDVQLKDDDIGDSVDDGNREEYILILLSGLIGQNIDLILNDYFYESLKKFDKEKVFNLLLEDVFNGKKNCKTDMRMVNDILPDILNKNKQSKDYYLGDRVMFIIDKFREERFVKNFNKLVEVLLIKRTLNRKELLREVKWLKYEYNSI